MSDGKIESDIFQETDFSDGDASARLINSWVEEITKNKIKELVDPSTLNSLTRLLLVSGIYFKGTWDSKFDVEETTDEVVHFNIRNF